MFQILNFLGFEPSPLSNTRITFTFSAGFACAFGEARFFLAGAAAGLLAGDGCAGPSPGRGRFLPLGGALQSIMSSDSMSKARGFEPAPTTSPSNTNLQS